MQFSCAIIVENLREDTWMPIEEVFVEDRIIIRQICGEPAKTCGGYLLERMLVGFMSYTTNIQDYAIFTIHERTAKRRNVTQSNC